MVFIRIGSVMDRLKSDRHYFNNLLAHIIGCAELILVTKDSQTEQQLKEKLEFILSAAEKLKEANKPQLRKIAKDMIFKVAKILESDDLTMLSQNIHEIIQFGFKADTLINSNLDLKNNLVIG